MTAATREPTDITFSRPVVKKVTNGKIFCMKGNPLRLKSNQKLSQAFTLDIGMYSTFGRFHKGPTIPKVDRFQTEGSRYEKSTTYYCPSLETVVASNGKGIRSAVISKLSNNEVIIDRSTPGVGDYEWGHMISTGRNVNGGGFSKLDRSKHTQIQKVFEKPGPGDCTPKNVSGPTAPVWSFSRSPRFNSEDKSEIGPGHYGIPTHKPKTIYIPKGPARDPHITCSYKNLRLEQYAAGPGSYNVRSTFRNRTSPAIDKRWAAYVPTAPIS